MMETIIKMLEAMNEDVDYMVLSEGTMLHVTINDFEGFDENWSEIMRDYDEEAVDGLIEWLEEHCVSTDGDLYSYYEFEGFTVQLGYSSYDI